MDVDQLASKFPIVWHATFAGGWDGIRRSGLRPAADLLHLAGRSAEASVLRTEIVRVSTPKGQATLRNQVPNRKDPTPCLDGVTPAEWWETLNSRSYLFGDEGALDRLVGSYLRQGVTQEVVAFRSRPLLEGVADHIEVATVNAGVFPRTTTPSRGRRTFRHLSEFDEAPSKIKEITVTAPLVINESAVIEVTRLTAGHDPRPIWPPLAGA